MNDDAVQSLLERLAHYRHNLAHLLRQAADAGGLAQAALPLVNAVANTRAEIAGVKAGLRQLGVEAPDLPDDLDLRPDAGAAPDEQRLARLRALLHDHTGFMQDRLASFVGRAVELAEVRRRVAELLPTGGYVSITAQAGQGKSCLIARLVELALRELCGPPAPRWSGWAGCGAGAAGGGPWGGAAV